MHLSASSPTRLAGAAAIACAAALIPMASLAATAAPSAPAAITASCATSGLVVWMNTQGDGAAGTIYYTLEFTNLSGHACTLRGNPGVSAVSLGGQQLGAPARWSNAKTSLVRLASGATATAVLMYSDVATSNNSCKTKAAGLRVYPPNQTESKVIPFPITACTRRGLVYLGVEPVQKSDS